MDIETAIKNRRSIRRFKDKPVSDESISYMTEMASWAPSSCNRQLWHFVCINNAQFQKKLKPICKSLSNINPPKIIFALYDNRFNLSHHANVQSAAAAVQNMLLAAYSKGLGTVWIENYGPEEKIKQILGIPKDLTIFAAVAVGYPAETPIPPKRRPVSEILHFENFAGGVYPSTNNPKKWTFNKIKTYVDCAVSAESPQKNFNKPYLMAEFNKEIKKFSTLTGKILFIYPVYGNYLFSLIESKKIKGDLHACCFGKGVINYLTKKRENIGIKNNIKFTECADEKLPFKDDFFDFIVCAKKIEAVPNRKKLISEIKRTLKPKANALFIINNSWSVYSILKRLFYRFSKTLGRESVETNGPMNPISFFKISPLLKNFKILKWNGIDILPYIKIHGPPFFGMPIIPIKAFERFSTSSFLKMFCNSQFILAEKK